MVCKKTFLFIITLFFIASLKISAQTTDSLKQQLSKEWIIKKHEQFGVADDPTNEQKNDKISLKSDMTCAIIENGKSYSGKWTIDKTRTYVICTLNNGAIKKSYKIVSLKGKDAIFEYQAPDLIRTKYHVTAK